jgi:PAS domain S-box-containing protein
MNQGKTADILGKPLRLLVVEDCETDFDLLQYRLKALPSPVQALRVEAREGLTQALNEHTWDLVISDHRLPGFGSEEALDIVRRHNPDLPFMIVSGAIGEDIAVEAMRSGADDYLMKDNLKRLVPAIERSLRAADEKKAKRSALSEQRASEERLRAIAANIPGIIIQLVYTPDTQACDVPLVSDAALHVFGMSAQSFSEHPGLLLEQFLTEDVAQLRHLLFETSHQDEAIQWEGRLRRTDGDKPRWMVLNARKSRQSTAQRSIWDGVLLDISTQKQAEADLLDSQLELRRVTEAFEQRRENERGAIAREIHDDIGGTLTKLKADIAWIKRRHGKEQDMAERLLDMLDLVDHTVLASQRIARDLRPGILDYGLVPALEWQIADFRKRTELQAQFTCNVEEIHLDGKVSTAVFRVLQESLTNVLKYAQASQVNVELFVDEENITLEIQDDGVGIDPTDLKKSTSFGVRGMNERAQSLGGWLDINSAKGKGTTLMLSIPRH